MSTTSQQEIIQRQQQIIRALQNELRWEKALFSNPTLKPPDKLIIWKTTPLEVKRGQIVEQPEEKKLYIAKLADEVGLSPDTFGSRLQRIADSTQALVYRRVREPAQDGTPVLRVYVAPTPALATPEKIELPPTGAGHGGRRIKSCSACGSNALVETRQIICTTCGHAEEKTVHPVNPPDEETISQDDGWHNQDFFVPAAPQLDEVLPPITPPQIPQVSPVESEVEQSADSADLPPVKMTPGSYPLNGFSCKDWLQRRIGNNGQKLIVATGKLEQSKKYISIPLDQSPNIDAYLQGSFAHIYGSAPLNIGGETTQLLAFDFDDDQPEYDAQHGEYLTALAAAGAAPVYWQRRKGRGHLELYFDAPVNAQAAYQWAIAICPALAEVEECYPIGDKRINRLSWPLYYRIGNTVMECEAEVMFPGDQAPMKSTGIQSDRARLTWLLSQAITPAARIPEFVPQATNEAPPPRGGLLDQREPQYLACTSDGLGKAVIAEFNDLHTWEEITASIGGVKDARFRAVWRGERTPSVIINADGSAHDFGKTGSFPNHFDKFEAWCLICGLDKKDEVKRLIAEYKRQHPESAGFGSTNLDYLATIPVRKDHERHVFNLKVQEGA